MRESTKSLCMPGEGAGIERIREDFKVISQADFQHKDSLQQSKNKKQTSKLQKRGESDFQKNHKIQMCNFKQKKSKGMQRNRNICSI